MVGFFAPDVTPVNEDWGDAYEDDANYTPPTPTMPSSVSSFKAPSTPSTKGEVEVEEVAVSERSGGSNVATVGVKVKAESTTGNTTARSCKTPLLDAKSLSPRELLEEIKDLPADCDCSDAEPYPGHEAVLKSIPRSHVYEQLLAALKVRNFRYDY